MSPFELLFAWWQAEEERKSAEAAKAENDRYIAEMNALLDRQLAEERKAEEAEAARIEKEKLDELKRLEDERLSTVWTAQKILESRLKVA